MFMHTSRAIYAWTKDEQSGSRQAGCRLTMSAGSGSCQEPCHRDGMTTALVHPNHVHDPSLSADVYPDDELVQELTDSMHSRLTAAANAPALELQVRSTLEELAPVHVTKYLGVLVERRLRRSGQVTRPHR
jgi:hypothetical protein